MRKLTAGTYLAGLALASSACAFGRGTADDFKRPQDPGGAVQLNVTNNFGGPVEVYAAGSGTLYRIGTVHPGLPGRFVVRPTMIVNGPVEFVARALNGPYLRSGRILVQPGDVVDFDLTASPVTSTATVRPRLVGSAPAQMET
ncbi:MAG TPA: hypothetical protein VH700_04155 [Gemmatimonadales bacterium]|jgi:hypothetical protein